MTWKIILVWFLAYLIGAIPFGWMIVWQVKHIDIRYHASGRMGMSNVLRTAGTFWGILSGVLDVAKGFFAIYVVRWILPDCKSWVIAIAGVLCILGHIYSVFVIERRRDNRIYFRGGAGGLTSIGVSMGIWLPIFFYIAPATLILYVMVGYASIPTALFNLFGAIGFAVEAIKGNSSYWWYVGYSLCALALVCWSLRPNFKRLFRGEERKTSLRIHWKKEKDQPDPDSKTDDSPKS